MIYKRALMNTYCPLYGELDNLNDIDILPVDKHIGTVPDEWTQNWWLKNLGKKSLLGCMVWINRRMMIKIFMNRKDIDDW